MEMWEQDYVDMEVPGYIAVDKEGYGEFQFGLVHGSFFADPEKAYISTEWEGHAEMDEAYGEISARVEEEKLQGTIYFSNGDESEFRAVPENKKQSLRTSLETCKA